MLEPIVNKEVEDLAADAKAPVVNDKVVSDKVEISREAYEQLLDRLEELESTPLRSNEIDDVDYLADEVVKPVQQQQVQPRVVTPINYDEMNNQQLATHIINTVVNQISNMAQPLGQEIQTLKVMREIDNCNKKYDDFSKYEKEIMQLAIKTPTLSIDDAYQLAKAKSPKKGDTDEKGGEVKRTKTERLLNLPSRSQLGDKPGVASASTKEVKVLTLEQAAQAAFDKIDGKKLKFKGVLKWIGVKLLIVCSPLHGHIVNPVQ
jgi:hypothetical protein